MNPYIYVGLKPEDRGLIRNIMRSTMQFVISDSVSKYTNIPFEDIISQKRYSHLSESRHILCFFIKKYTKMKPREIGDFVGNRDRTTVIHSVRTVENLMSVDPRFKLKIEEIDKIIINKIRI